MTRVALAAIRGYRLLLAPFVGGGCRFHPSCSEYALQVISRDGAWHGGRAALRRLARCRPFGGGGLDLPEALDGLEGPGDRPLGHG